MAAKEKEALSLATLMQKKTADRAAAVPQTVVELCWRRWHI